MKEDILKLIKELPEEKKQQLINTAMDAQNADDLLEKIKAAGIELNKEDAEAVYKEMAGSVRLTQEELAKVSGGGYLSK